MENKTEKSFEEYIKELEEIVHKLDGGTAGLEESLTLFQEGVKLSKTCNDILSKAEKSVSLLTAENEE